MADVKSSTPECRSIPPKDGAGFVDQFWSGMYGTLCSFGQSEQRLIWMRYSAFLIVHGIIFGFVKDCAAKPPDHAMTLLCSGLLGLLVCCVWGFLNYCGWKNQNMFFWYAWRLKFEDANLKLPTDYFGGSKPPEPYGTIYRSAQLLPLAFGIVDCVSVFPATAGLLPFGDLGRWVAVTLLGFVCILAVIVCCRQVRGRDIA